MSERLPGAPALEAIREQASDRWRDALDDAPEGWSVSALDPAPILSPFDVTLAADWELVVLTARWGRDGRGRVLAVLARTAAEVRDRLAGTLADYEEFEPPPVPEAASDPGRALLGERTARGLLMASLAVRELAELGARGHGRAWLEEEIVEGRGALPDLPPASDAPVDPQHWTWREPAVEDWSPAVSRRDGCATVRFFTYQPVGGHEIARHEDVYPADGLAATRTRTPVATAPGGIRH